MSTEQKYPLTMCKGNYPAVALDQLEEKYLRGCGFISLDEFLADQKRIEAEQAEQQKAAEAAKAQAEAEDTERRKKADTESAIRRKEKNDAKEKKQAAEEAMLRRLKLCADAYNADRLPLEQRLIRLREEELRLEGEAEVSSRGNRAGLSEIRTRLLEITQEIPALKAKIQELHRALEADYNAKAAAEWNEFEREFAAFIAEERAERQALVNAEVERERLMNESAYISQKSLEEAERRGPVAPVVSALGQIDAL